MQTYTLLLTTIVSTNKTQGPSVVQTAIPGFVSEEAAASQGDSYITQVKQKNKSTTTAGFIKEIQEITAFYCVLKA